ncbi:squalene/phytoene synthase family protein [Phaeobacter inhibens]|uniref:squalene/phytoene synthase family protein n=1 Tax=Phaeobacter inhibens TaxID=221822 RepID=UPI0021A54555|nr:squalene/phytoene synthase family protein [Phaeobacter inhibens]UWR54572.1 squalene/phytoene synthase family protein [Phaeobacter inhibens]
MATFDDDLIACADLVQKGDPDRFATVMASPVSTRAALFAIYAFNLELARAPWASTEAMIAEMRVQWWRDVGAEIAAGGPVRRHFVATPLAKVLRPDLAVHIDAMAEARRWDIYRDPFEDEAALADHIDKTTGSLMWMAAATLGARDQTLVRRFAYGVGVANWLRAIPKLVAEKRVPLLDGTPEGVRALAQDGLAALKDARANRGAMAASSLPALLPGWQADKILQQAVAAPQRVADDALGTSEFRRRTSLIYRVSTGRW